MVFSKSGSSGLTSGRSSAHRQPAPVSDAFLRRFTAYSIQRTNRQTQADLLRRLRPMGLKMLSFAALSLVVENPGLRQVQLANALDIDRAQILLVVDELLQAEWISRARSSDDRRANVLHVTELGQKIFERALVEIEAHEARMTADISAAEREELIAALRQIEINGRGG